MNRITLVLVTLGFVLFAACGESQSDDGEIAQDPTATSAPTPTEVPEASPTPEVEPTVTPSGDDAVDELVEDDDALLDEEDPTEEDSSSDDTSGHGNDQFGAVPDVYIEDFHDQTLSELLLITEQMPEGWSVMVEGSLPEDAEATQGLGDMMSGPCENELLTPEAMGNPLHVGRQFIGQDLGPFFTQDLYQFDDEASAVAAMDMASAQLDCDDWTGEDPTTGMEVQYSLEDLEFPELGDDMAAVSLGISVSSDVQAGVQTIQHPAQYGDLFENLRSEMVLVRQGNLFSSFTYMNWFGGDELNLEDLVTQAVEQIDAAR